MRRRSDLVTRSIAGVVMIAVALAAVWAGGWAFWLLATAAAAAMLAEWAKLVNAARWKMYFGLALLLVLLLFSQLAIADLRSGAAAVLGAPDAANEILRDVYVPMVETAGIAAIVLAVATWNARLGIGLLYVGLPVLGLLYLRALPTGFALALWTFAIVWATDIGAYFSGRRIGGPKLAPRLSPNKTWAGLIGGVLAALLVGSAIAAWTGLTMRLAIFAPLLAVAAQAGDLFESWLKRKAAVKDSGNILPGHGGALDRLDGMVPVAILTASLYAAGMV